MRRLALLVLMLYAGSAQAMNWEGHDDWLADHPAAAVYGAVLPAAKPEPDSTASCGDKAIPANPYEQIAAGKAACREKAPVVKD